MTDFNDQVEAAVASAVPAFGPYSIYWLNEHGPHERIAKNKSLEMAFLSLMKFSGTDSYSFERIDGVMTLLHDNACPPFRRSENPDDALAKREIMEHAVGYAWGEYAAERDDDAVGFV